MLAAAAFTLFMNIENPPRSGSFEMLEGFQTLELCEEAARDIEKTYKSLAGVPNNFYFSHSCKAIKKAD